MSKVWFIFDNGRHLGPFTHEDIELRFSSGKIDENVLIWREGRPAWEALKDEEEFHSLFSHFMVTDLPTLPVESDDECVELPPIPEEETVVAEDDFEEDDFEELEEEHLLDRLVNTEKIEEEIENEVKEEIEEDIGATSKRSKWFKIILGFISLAAVLTWAIFFFHKDVVIVPKDQLSNMDFERLSSVTRLYDKEKKFELALSKDKKSFILTTNFTHHATLYLMLSSLKGKVFSDDDIQVSSIAHMNNQVAIFSDLQMKNSTDLKKGLYLLQLRGIDTSLRVRFFKFLKRIEFLRNIDFIKNIDDKFYYSSEYLLGFPDYKVYQEELKIYNDEQMRKRLQPVREVLERYKTYYAMIRKLTTLFKDTLELFNRKGTVQKFEKSYQMEIAPLYQHLTIENKKIQVSLIESNYELSLEYQKLVTFGKEIGIIVADMTEQFEKYHTFKKRKRFELLQEFQTRLLELEELGKMRIHKIEDELKRN